MAGTKKVSTMGAAAILTLSLVSMGVTVVTPAMAAFAQHFEGKDVSWISTLPTLFVVLATIFAGNIMGRRVKYRTLAIVGSLLYLVGGCSPAFFDNYTLTLVCRAVLGFGIGLMSPLANALVLGLYDGQKQASMLGYGTLCMNAGGIILQMLGGSLAEVGWNYTFYGHAFCLIGLIMAFFLPEPVLVQGVQKSMEGVEKKEKLGKMVWVIAGVFALINLLNFPIMMNISILFEIREAGGTAAAATSLSMYTVAGCVAGLVFGKLFQFAKRWCLTIGFAIAGIGAVLIYTGQVALVMTIGLMLIGFGFSVLIPSFMSWTGIATPASTIAVGISVLMAFMNLGGFLSSFWLKFLNKIAGESLYSAIIVEIAVFFGLAIIFVLFNPFKKKE